MAVLLSYLLNDMFFSNNKSTTIPLLLDKLGLIIHLLISDYLSTSERLLFYTQSPTSPTWVSEMDIKTKKEKKKPEKWHLLDIYPIIILE